MVWLFSPDPYMGREVVPLADDSGAVMLEVQRPWLTPSRANLFEAYRSRVAAGEHPTRVGPCIEHQWGDP